MDKRKPVIFLSASMPNKEKNLKFFETADFIAIRDAVVALVNALIPHYCLVWGGHPAITPIIHEIFRKRNFSYNDYISVYQSEIFVGQMPQENFDFDNIIITDAVRLDNGAIDKDKSLALMRKRMLTDNPIYASVFIGGMEGVLEEYKLVKKYAPKAKIFPIASTGAAARFLYDKLLEEDYALDDNLLTNYCYASLFDKLLADKR